MRLIRTTLLFLLLAITPLAYAQAPIVFVVAKLSEPIKPLERAYKYDGPLDQALQKARAGQVTGGGVIQNKEKKVEGAMIEIELTDFSKGIPLIKKTLLDLGAPKSSVLEYQYQGQFVTTPLFP